jgi:hypothetical protein
MKGVVVLLGSFFTALNPCLGQDTANINKLKYGAEFRWLFGANASNPISSVNAAGQESTPLYARKWGAYSPLLNANSFSLGLTLDRGRSSLILGPTLDRVTGRDTTIPPESGWHQDELVYNSIKGKYEFARGPIYIEVEQAKRMGGFAEYRYYVVPRVYYDESFFVHTGYSNRRYSLTGISGSEPFERTRLSNNVNHTLYGGFGFFFWRTGLQAMGGISANHNSIATKDVAVSSRRFDVFIGFGLLFRIK